MTGAGRDGARDAAAARTGDGAGAGSGGAGAPGAAPTEEVWEWDRRTPDGGTVEGGATSEGALSVRARDKRTARLDNDASLPPGGLVVVVEPDPRVG